MNKQILNIAIPSIVSNITVPLCAMVDTIIAGHLGNVSYIGAIAVGGLLFNMTYWLFGFLRMGTSGLTAQTYGEGDKDKSRSVLLRSLLVAMALSLLLLAFQRLILHVAFQFIEATPEVQTHASTYFNILIWGAPAVLSLYSFVGWFLGMQNARFTMTIAIVQNVTNIIASTFLVLFFHLKIEGVAVGTLVAQYVGLLLSVALCYYRYRWVTRHFCWTMVFKKADFTRFFSVNRDIFLRTLCLIAVTTYFTSYGSAQGELTLAANTLLMQFFIIFSYVMDGFAYAGEAIGGKCYGERSLVRFSRLMKCLFVWGLGISLLFMLIYFVGGEKFLNLFTNDHIVISQATNYLWYVYLLPLVSFSAFLFDGLYIGTTSTRYMLVSMLFAMVVFFVIVYTFHSDNHILWTAFLAYLGMRGLMQFVLFKRVKKKFIV